MISNEDILDVKAWLPDYEARKQSSELAQRKISVSKMAEAEGMEVDSPAVPSTSSGSIKKRFEVKKVEMLFNLPFLY